MPWCSLRVLPKGSPDLQPLNSLSSPGTGQFTDLQFFLPGLMNFTLDRCGVDFNNRLKTLMQTSGAISLHNVLFSRLLPHAFQLPQPPQNLISSSLAQSEAMIHLGVSPLTVVGNVLLSRSCGASKAFFMHFLISRIMPCFFLLPNV